MDGLFRWDTGAKKGYCVDLDCGDGSLARELALRSELQVIALTPDVSLATAAREALAAEGLYGTRVTVLQADLTNTRLPNRLANLIVSGSSVLTGRTPSTPVERRRLQRPYGGVMCFGK